MVSTDPFDRTANGSGPTARRLYKEVKDEELPDPEGARRGGGQSPRSPSRSPPAAAGGGDSGDGNDRDHVPDPERRRTTRTRPKALIAAFEKANPDITVKLETQPGGTEGDNLMKTKLSTGEMDDVFHYNSGSLLPGAEPRPDPGRPERRGVGRATSPTTSRPSSRPTTASTARRWGTSFAGAVLYNKKVYADLGLEVPTTWDEFIANSEKIKADGGGIAPILQTYGDTWTSQLFVLGDFANVLGAGPGLGRAVHRQRPGASTSTSPRSPASRNQQEVFETGCSTRTSPR